MKRFIFCLVVILTIAGVSNTLGQSRPTEEQSWKKLNDKSRLYLVIGKDLLEMARAQKHDIIQFQCVMDLATSANQANDYLSAASDIVYIYDMINARSDKGRVKPYIKQRLEQYSQALELTIKLVNLSLSNLTISGIAATGTRLRDELRDGQSLLSTVEIR